MDTDAQRPDELSDLERRLSSWEPASQGLDADVMLFAAGRATARTGSARIVWPALTGFLVVLVVALGTWAATERAERLRLAQQLQQRPSIPMPLPPPSAVIPAEPSTAEEPAPDSLLIAHRALEHGLAAWPPRAIDPGEAAHPPSNPLVLQVGHRDALLEQ